MRLRGIIRNATLVEVEPAGDAIEMELEVQGVGPGQPRRLVIPYALLLHETDLDPDAMKGHGFEAEVESESPRRWVVRSIALASGRVLRPEDGPDA
jgi:hypothetical protein